jgi:hypothetical protein
MKKAGIIRLSLVTVLAASSATSDAKAGGVKAHASDGVVASDGSMRVPSDYRSRYEFLGSWAIAGNAGTGSKEMHVVYASPGSAAAYRKDGRFPDGTVLVKEVREAATSSMTTGTVSHATAIKGWFVMVKDSKGTHPDNKLWGDGWGWSWFDKGAPTKTTSTDYHHDCLTCHVPARNTDWIYVDGYADVLHGGS